MAKINDGLFNINESINIEKPDALVPVTQAIQQMSKLISEAKMHVEVVNQPVPGMDKVLHSMSDAITTSLLPVVSAMRHKLDMDHDIWQRVKNLGKQISSLEKSMVTKTKVKVDLIDKK
ncbi:MAG: hypothetical protein MJK11_10080 [Pseudomonadales bacterium]|nr:hypothetical protein [Pseudomonadales bacterium]